MSAANISAASFGANTGGGNYTFPASLGIGASPATTLDVRSATPAITVGKTDNTDGAVYFGNSGHGIRRNYSTTNDVGLYTTSGNVALYRDPRRAQS